MSCLVLGCVCRLSAATVPAGFTETAISGPWSDAVGTAFESNGRMYVWERTGKVWFKDTTDASFTQLLNISEEVGAWEDHGMLGFALDPNFRVNGYIYVLYVVDRYYLLNFGLPGYNPNSNQYNAATIGRLTRYTCRSSDGFRSVDPASRLILIGETKQTGFPVLSYTHGVGSLVFGEDGTLLVSCGDGATADTADQGGAVSGNYTTQGLTDGIIRPKEDVGALRSQLVDSLNGKVLRIDPATGNGLPSNPYYDSGNPRSARSRVWALGLRNPCRMSLRPESGSHYPADGNPGVLYIGDVGWNTWECLRVVTGPKQNCGWPIYEGLSVTAGYDGNVANQDAPNPLYPASGCSQYLLFSDLLKEDTLAAAGQPPFNNPCNSSQKIPSSIPQFLHVRPALDWNHASATTRTPTYGGSGQAQTANVGAGGSPVSGTQFQGNCAIGGTWYIGTGFPAQYQNRYFFADWGQGVIKTLTFDANDKPLALGDFASAAGAVVSIVQHPIDGSLYYISYNFSASTIQQLAYTGNRTPVAVASADKYYGPTPLAVQFSSSGSSDPDGQPITYSWNFGDGSAVSTNASPPHTFSASVGVPTKYVVTLTVTDSGGLSAQATLIVSVNNTPPNVTITSPVNGALYSPTNATTVNLTATVSDAESSNSQLLYQWQTLLHHNDHNHSSPADTNHVTTTVIEPTGCDGINIYYYRIILTVTDPAGLSTTREVRLYPDCGPNTPPTISGIANQTIFQNSSTGPIAFTVGDAEAAAANLQLSASSSDSALVPTSNIVFGGSGSNRTVTVTPVPGLTGSATITVTVNDGPNNTSTNFVLTVNPLATLTVAFTNATPITIPDQGTATPYPSYIPVTGMSGTISNVIVRLNGFNHTWANDADVLLVGPGGQRMRLMENAGTGSTVNANLIFSNNAAASLPQTGALPSGTYKPTAYSPATTYPSPAPAGPYGTNFTAFIGTTPNGTWSLYVFDDGPGDQGSISGGWSLTITTVSLATSNTPPIISGLGNQTINEDTVAGPIAFTVGDVETAAGSLTVSGVSSNQTLVPDGNIVFGGSGSNRTVTVTPAANQNGTTLITVSVSDGSLSSNTSFLVTVNAVNDPPTISSIGNQVINEDTVAGPVAFTVGDVETAAGSLTVSGVSSNQTLVPNGNIVFGGSGSNRTVTMTPVANQNGTTLITVSVSDGSLSSNTSFLVTVNAVNDAPTISSLGNQVINEDTVAGPVAFTVGDVETAAGSLTVSGVSSNQTLVPNGNIVFGGSGSNRTVTMTPVANQNGTTLITMTVSDGSLSSNTSFLVTVNAVNDPPTISSLGNQVINEDTVAGPLAFTVGDVDTPVGSLTVSGVSSNQTLVPDGNVVFGGSGSNRTVTVTPAANQNGTTQITVTVSDGQLSTNTSFVVTVNPVNDPPTISSIANQVINEDTVAGPIAFTVGDIDTPVGSLTLSGVSSNQTLVPNGNIVFGGSGSNRTVTVTPAANQNGTTLITASVSDGQLSTNTSFVVTVNPVNDPPTISSIGNQTIDEDTVAGPIAFTVGDIDTPVGSLTVTGVSSNQTLVPDGNIVFGGSSSNRTVTVTPAANQNGTTLITASVSDGSLSSNASFLVTVNPVNDAPTITAIANQVIDEDTVAGPIAFTVGDVDTPVGSLTVTGVSSNQTLVPDGNIVFGGSDSNRTVTVTPAANQNGTTLITVSVSDGSLSNNTSFLVTVNPVNDPPTISSIGNQTIDEDTVAGPIAFTVGDIDTPVGSLTVTGVSSNQTLVPDGNIVFGGSDSNRTVTVTPAANQNGTTLITVTVSDGELSSNTSFFVTVNAPFVITSITLSGDNEVNLVWNGRRGTNVVEVSTGESSGHYTGTYLDLASNVLSGAGVTNYIDSGGATNGPSRYYRIRLIQP